VFCTREGKSYKEEVEGGLCHLLGIIGKKESRPSLDSWAVANRQDEEIVIVFTEVRRK